MHIRVKDTVEVITGDDRGVRGKVLSVDRSAGKLLVEGVNRVYKHVRRSQRNPQGGRLSKEMPVQMSNVLTGLRRLFGRHANRRPVPGRRQQGTVLQEMRPLAGTDCPAPSGLCQEVEDRSFLRRRTAGRPGRSSDGRKDDWTIMIPRLITKNTKRKCCPRCEQQLGRDNRLSLPRLEKIVVNMGVGSAITEKKHLEDAVEALRQITGQKPVITTRPQGDRRLSSAGRHADRLQGHPAETTDVGVSRSPDQPRHPPRP